MEVNHVGTYVFNGTLKDLGKLEYASHGVDIQERPKHEERKKTRQERRAAERAAKKNPKKPITTAHSS